MGEGVFAVKDFSGGTLRFPVRGHFGAYYTHATSNAYPLQLEENTSNWPCALVYLPSHKKNVVDSIVRKSVVDSISISSDVFAVLHVPSCLGVCSWEVGHGLCCFDR